MRGLMIVFRKELGDHFSSFRFVIMFALIAMVSIVLVYMAAMGLKEALEGSRRPSFVFMMLFTTSGGFFSMTQFVGFFGPLIGLLLGFDAINRERATGTLSKLVSQPIYRDTVINGKFLASVVTIAIMFTAIMLIVSGLGLVVLGIVPGVEEILRMAVYLFLSIMYVSFWLALAILCSVIFRSVATSALAALAAWIFFSFFVSLGADVMANAVAPVDKSSATPEVLMKHMKVRNVIELSSPISLYSNATSAIIDPTRQTTKSLVMMGRLEKLSMERFRGPLPLGQSLLVVFPYLTILVALTLASFGITYWTFMLQEIRAM